MNRDKDKMIFPDLETERLYLRQLTDEDIGFIYKQFSDPQVAKYLMDEPPVKEIAEAQGIIDFYKEPELKTRNRWGIVLKNDNQLVGTIGYHKWIKKYFRAEIGFDLHPDFWGRGIMMEALRIVIRHGFTTMGLNRIDGLVYIDNNRCLKLMERSGFKREGILQDYFYLNGKFYDHYLLALLKKDWNPESV
ncbi:MAG: GNAT family protein [Candidatus Zixiibacteriota bacterium]